MRNWRDPREYPIVVGFSSHRQRWVARAPEGDYGISQARRDAIAYAMDAVASGGRPERVIEVQNQDGTLACRILRVKQAPSSQLFQDGVS